MDILIEKAS